MLEEIVYRLNVERVGAAVVGVAVTCPKPSP
jgi:hypothetical protein